MSEKALHRRAMQKAYAQVRYVSYDVDWRDVLSPPDFVEMYAADEIDVDELEGALTAYFGIERVAA